MSKSVPVKSVPMPQAESPSDVARTGRPIVTLTYDQWMAWRAAAGRSIDPKTAEVIWDHRLTLDPYGVGSDIHEENQQVGREYFARAPGTDLWIAFGDLPKPTRETLWQKHKANLAFPAGLPSPEEKEEINSRVDTPASRDVVELSQTIALTIAEVCATGRVGRTAVYDAIKAGKLRAIKRGRRTLVLPVDLRRWLEKMPARNCEKAPP
jgi:excisionase family DNA binding protein